MSYVLPNLQTLRTAARAASLVVNAVVNATLTVTADAAGFDGNQYTVAIVTGAPTLDQALTAALAGAAITVTLGTDGAGVLDDTKNTGTLVAAAIDALAGVSCTTSVTGAGIVAPVAVQSLAGGADVMTVTQLAHRANMSDLHIIRLENNARADTAAKLPFTVKHHEALRIANALGVNLVSDLGGADINV
jgi:hypothetical protein